MIAHKSPADIVIPIMAWIMPTNEKFVYNIMRHVKTFFNNYTAVQTMNSQLETGIKQIVSIQPSSCNKDKLDNATTQQ